MIVPIDQIFKDTMEALKDEGPVIKWGYGTILLMLAVIWAALIAFTCMALVLVPVVVFCNL